MLLLYQNTGWRQFGYRFSNDYAPLLFVLLAIGKRPFTWLFWTFAAWGVVVNAFGAITFDRGDSRADRYYFRDESAGDRLPARLRDDDRTDRSDSDSSPPAPRMRMRVQLRGDAEPPRLAARRHSGRDHGHQQVVHVRRPNPDGLHVRRQRRHARRDMELPSRGYAGARHHAGRHGGAARLGDALGRLRHSPRGALSPRGGGPGGARRQVRAERCRGHRLSRSLPAAPRRSPLRPARHGARIGPLGSQSPPVASR